MAKEKTESSKEIHRHLRHAQVIAVRSSSVRIEAEMDARGFLRVADNVRPGFKYVRATFTIDAPSDPETLRKIIHSSPMFDEFSNPVTVDLNLKVQ